MTSAQIREHLEPLQARHKELQQRATQIAGELATLKAARVDALAAGGNDAGEGRQRIADLSSDHEAVTAAIARVEASMQLVANDLHAALANESHDAARAGLAAAERDAIAARDALGDATYTFLNVTLPPLLARVDATQKAGRDWVGAVQASAAQLGVAPPGNWCIDRYRNASEAQLITQLSDRASRW
jgi:chromosome segregation ATPase